MNPHHFPHIRNITVSGRIASGATTLAKGLADALHWKMWEGGALVEKFYKDELKKNEVDVNARPDSHELWFEAKVKQMLQEDSHMVVQSHLAGFTAQGLDNIFKILVLCDDEQGLDKPEIRIDRLLNRKNMSIEDAKKNVIEREEKNVAKWRRLYVPDDPHWVYWDKKYYDLVVSTYMHNQEETVNIALDALQNKK